MTTKKGKNGGEKIGPFLGYLIKKRGKKG